ncbi:MAG: site-specific integrase [Candidatus Aenigmatarchaeota archaeon]
MKGINLTEFGRWLETAKCRTGHKFSKVSKEKYRSMENWIEPIDETASFGRISDIYSKCMQEHNYPSATAFFKNYLRFVFRNDRKKLKKVLLVLSKDFETPPTSKRDASRKTLTRTEIEKINEFIDNIDRYVKGNMIKENSMNLLRERKDVISLLLRICYDTGARIKEFQSIRLKDVNLDENYITLIRKRAKTRRKQVSEKTVEMLRSYLDSKQFKPNDKVFDISYTKIYTSLKLLGSMAIGRAITPHFLRFSVLQHLADDGATERQLLSFGDLDSYDTVSCYVKNSKIQEQRALEHHPSFKTELQGGDKR